MRRAEFLRGSLGVVTALFAFACSRHSASTNTELITPAVALRSLGGNGSSGLKSDSLYWNAPALPWLLEQEATRVRDEDRAGTSPRMRAFAQATQDPKLFRKLDRELRFDAVWLLGDPSTFKPLLDHLLETRDFALTWLDHTSLIFHRASRAPWSAEELDRLRVRFQDAGEQAAFLAGAATRLLAVRDLPEAKRRLEQADALDRKAPVVSAAWASYHLVQGDFPAAREAAARALATDPDFLPALACLTQSLYALKDVNGAWELSQKLLARSPDDPGLLFYHAKLAHEAHAYTDEIRTLRRLITLAERAGASVSGYRVYLGQAHAADGDSENAIDQLTLALLDTELPREQRTFADRLFLQIKDRAGLPGMSARGE